MTHDQSQDRLSVLAGELLAMVCQPVAPRGREITRQRWEVAVRAKLAEVFRYGMGVGGTKALDILVSESERFQVEEARDLLGRWSAGRGGPGAPETESVLADHIRGLLVILDRVAPKEGDPDGREA